MSAAELLVIPLSSFLNPVRSATNSLVILSYLTESLESRQMRQIVSGPLSSCPGLGVDHGFQYAIELCRLFGQALD